MPKSRRALPQTDQVPLYRQVRHEILRHLANGRWSVYEALPSEQDLADEFQISIGTLRKAIDELVNEHILVRHQGLGTFIKMHSKERSFRHFFHLIDSDGQKCPPHRQLLDFTETADEPKAQEALKLPETQPLIRIRNALLIDQKIIEIYDAYIDKQRVNGMSRLLLEQNENPLYQFYQEQFNLHVVRTADCLVADQASAEDARLLRLEAGDPVLRIERTALSFDDEPVEFRISRVNTQNHAYLNNARANSSLG